MLEIACEGGILMTMTSVQDLWESYLAILPEPHAHRLLPLPEAWCFGDSPEMADDLGNLVMQGKKTATCSRYLGENILETSTISILLDGRKNPLGVVETFEITVRRYCDIDAEWAAAEGEGDLSLDFWRSEHWTFFTRGAADGSYTVSEDMLLACERLRIVHRA
jgi:uncharacterized protein YhfF